MRRIRQLGIVLLVAMNAFFLLAQTETFPRMRLVGGRSGVPIEVSSGNAMLTTLTGTAAQADDGTASTLPRYRIAGGTTGNLAEVDSTGHLLVTGIADTLTTGTGKQVLQTGPTLIAPALGLATADTLTTSGSITLANNVAYQQFDSTAVTRALMSLSSNNTHFVGYATSAALYDISGGSVLMYPGNALNTTFAADGSITAAGLASTGAASAKTAVCADTAGKLYRSASGYSCETTNVISGVAMQLIYCGQAAENGTIYFSPAAGVNGVTIGARPELSSATCDALDGATESTQDLIIFPQNAFRVMGMYCMQAGAEPLGAGETMVFTYRANAANVTPSVTCTISVGETGCSSQVATTTNVAANLPTAMQLVQTSNNSDQDGWCSVSVLLQ